MRTGTFIRCVALLLIEETGFAAQAPVQLRKLPAVGQVINLPQPDSPGLCMVSPGQMDPCAKVQVAGVHYTIAFRKRGLLRRRRVTYIHTADPNFRSPSGRRVGDAVEVTFAHIRPLLGYEIYAGEAASGWNGVVGFNGEVVLASSPAQTERVTLDSLRSSPAAIHRLRIVGFTAR